MSDESEKRPYENPDEIIQRLISEQTQTGNILKQIRREINSCPEFEGLSLIGGIKTIIRRYKEEQSKNIDLTKELNRLIKRKK